MLLGGIRDRDRAYTQRLHLLPEERLHLWLRKLDL